MPNFPGKYHRVAQHGRYNRAYSRAPGDYVNDNTNQHYAVRNIQPYGGNANNRGYVEIPATYSQARPTAEWANPPHGRRGVHADLRAMQQRHGFNEASPGAPAANIRGWAAAISNLSTRAPAANISVGGGYQQPQYQGSRGQHQVVGGGYQQPSYHTAVKLPQLPAVPQLPSLQQTSYETSGHGYQKPTYQVSGQQASGYQQPTYQTTGQQASGYQQPAATNQAYSAGAYQQQPQQQYASQPTGQQGQYTAQTGTSQSTYSSPVNQLPRPTSVIVPGVNYRRQEATPYSVAENAAKPTKYTSR
ncbi:PREDICTED: AT-rich interactive domain-containing protein 1A-like [Priapulus caudatus]|uniref:AT-rich interactive domain-containing protein 1A-like n=1 Tax=Priapulus caudatus TaxID=37621 RepID=A0ABM1DUF1_PRICU|nr:PREDICTED: AT-rich interactive domain-containing protein 1A-like [Priapulus caudatus]